MHNLGGGIMAGMAAGGDFDRDEDFYEEDEPLEEVLAAYERGIKGVTARPAVLELSGAESVLLGRSSGGGTARVFYMAAAPEPIRVLAAAAQVG
jgi:hypothetical protein